MTVRQEPRSGVSLGWQVDADGWGDPVNKNFEILARLGFQPAVISNTIITPPAAVHGDRYIVPSNGEGAWSGAGNNIAYYDTDAWVTYPPRKGFRFLVESDYVHWYWDGAAWFPEKWIGTQAQYDSLPAARKAATVATEFYIRP